MQSSCPKNSAPIRRNQSPRRFAPLLAGGVFFLAALALATGWAQQSTPNYAYLLQEANRLPDATDQIKMQDGNSKQQGFDAANEARKKQLSDDSAKLLTLAVALKAEVDKTNKDTLSLNVIRKADEIEKLARNVKEKMKVTVGGN